MKLRGGRISLFFAVALLLTGCGGPVVQPRSFDREAETASILEQAIRYGVHQFAPRDDADGIALCIAIREGGVLTDPDPSVMRRLNTRQAQPWTQCKAAATLLIGPIEWLGDDEVRVKAGYVRASRGESRLAYRVVRENGNWICVGPIISWDPQ